MIKIFCDVCTKPTQEPALFNAQTTEAFCKIHAPCAEEFLKGKAEIVRSDNAKHLAHIEQYRAEFLRKKEAAPKLAERKAG